MLPDALREVAGDTYVERTVALAGEDVNGGLHDLWLFYDSSKTIRHAFGRADFWNQRLQF